MAVIGTLSMLTGFVLLLGMILKLMNEGSLSKWDFVVGMLLAILVVGAIVPGTIMNLP